MKIIINENECGYLLKDGVFVKILKAGKYNYSPLFGYKIEITNVFGEVDNRNIPKEILKRNKEFYESISYIEVNENNIALHYADGVFKKVLTRGIYMFWNLYEKNTFDIYDISEINIPEKLIKTNIKYIPANYYEKITVNENSACIVYLNNKFYKQLNSGVYYFWKNNFNITYRILDAKSEIPEDIEIPENIELINISKFIVPQGHIGIHYVNDIFHDILLEGEHKFFNFLENHSVNIVDIQNPDKCDEIPKSLFKYIPVSLYKKIMVENGEIAILYFDNKYQKTLKEGIYYFWNYNINISHKIYDMKLQQMEINGQEILTLDKVGVRINVICSFKILNPIEIANKINDIEKQIYIYVQLVIREYIGKYKIDELLNQKEEVSKFIYNKLIEKQDEFYIKFYSSGIKDIILPGEIREIMNKVLIAEKNAQANVIMRREEVASTRSLLNTAKLMEENQILYKLKELEYLERICDKVGNISLNGGNLLQQLSEIAGSK